MNEPLIRLLVASAISRLLLLVGLYVLVLGSPTDGVEKAAIGWIGVVMGYWLK